MLARGLNFLEPPSTHVKIHTRTSHALHGAAQRVPRACGWRRGPGEGCAEFARGQDRRGGRDQHLPREGLAHAARQHVLTARCPVRHHDEGRAGRMEPADVALGDDALLDARGLGPVRAQAPVRGVPREGRAVARRGVRKVSQAPTVSGPAPTPQSWAPCIRAASAATKWPTNAASPASSSPCLWRTTGPAKRSRSSSGEYSERAAPHHPPPTPLSPILPARRAPGAPLGRVSESSQ